MTGTPATRCRPRAAELASPLLRRHPPGTLRQWPLAWPHPGGLRQDGEALRRLHGIRRTGRSAGAADAPGLSIGSGRQPCRLLTQRPFDAGVKVVHTNHFRQPGLAQMRHGAAAVPKGTPTRLLAWGIQGDAAMLPVGNVAYWPSV
jgi:hypothetical protein